MNPFQLMALLNVSLGAGRIALGFIMLTGGGVYAGQLIDNPLTYVASGMISILFGIGNWLRWQIATIGSMLMIALSIYDSQFGASNQDWRFWVLSVYAAVTTTLVLWSYLDTAKEVKAQNA
ncbi:hypothetical protein [Bremerella alba]|uniref:Uncharacterized protein n=1 Tax=Bremerella alba TaxID=980252 RepID=A0A7V9A8S4_9BACT|nr:hypothetical protein [Bremerella alba]MBA2116588.1 hypothetical protein [Bremerella alba]